MTLSDYTVSRQSGVKNFYFTQTYKGLTVYNAIVNVHLTRDNKVLAYGSRSLPGLAGKVNGSLTPALTAEEAVLAAARQLGYEPPKALTSRKETLAAGVDFCFSGGNLSERDIPVKLLLQPTDDGQVRLAWDLSILEPLGNNWWSVRIDAANGKLLHKTNWMLTCSFDAPGHQENCRHDHSGSTTNHNHTNAQQVHPPLLMAGQYRVYAEPVESPSHGSRSLVITSGNATASPFGWHDTDGVAGAEYTITRGNNVYAQLDDDGNTSTFGYAPDGGASLAFDYPVDLSMAPNTYIDAAVTNLFYWNNYIHDFSYRFGFDEGNGNFQENNYNRGGLGSDYVIAGAQDASGFNNAHFGTPPDGSRPTMRMKLWNTTSPHRDGDFDNGIIAHEYAHGISNRFTGGPSNTGCLGNEEQMGEGWSDFYSLISTIKTGDTGPMRRGIGTYALGQPITGDGIRPRPYTTDTGINEHTYNFIKTAAVPHGVGYVWAEMLWEMTWGLIDVHGFDPNFGPASGNAVALMLVNEGMKLQPCSPGFIDGRNAILAADQAIYGGANQCIIWAAFAKRGLGYSASQGSSNSRSDGTEAFDMPPAYLLGATETYVEVCQGTDAEFLLNVTSCTVSGTATLSAGDLPMGAVASFSPNPVSVPDGFATLTISNTAAIAPGTYNIEATATGSQGTTTIPLTIRVISSTLAAPALSAPATGATGVFTTPTLSWNAVVDANNYRVQIATDAAFTNIVHDVSNLTAISYSISPALNTNTVYHWRVRASNNCGSNIWSAGRSFTTGNFECIIEASADVPVDIPSANPITETSSIEIAECGAIADINVLNLNISHTNTDEVVVKLTSPFGTTVTLLDRECNISTANILINLDDQASGSNYPCPPTDNGFYQPRQPLAAFNGENPVGTWILSVTDLEPGDGGSINSWSLGICYTPAASNVIVTCYLDADGDGYGDQTPRAFCDACGDGFLLNNEDCDDANDAIKPGATEICDGIDNNCNGVTDEGFDQDNDGFTSCNGDCNDNDDTVYPGAPELCDNKDNNCNGSVDEINFPGADVPAAISASGTPVVTSTLVISCVSGNITDVDLRDLNISHSYVGDLKATLTGPDGVTIITLFDRPGKPTSGFGCGGNNIEADFNDQAVLTAANFENTCGNNPAISGAFQPVDPLAVFNGMSPNGVWTLTVIDAANGDGGALNSWELALETDAVSGIYYPDADGDGYGANTPITFGCPDPIGYVTNNDDCDDTNADINPTTVWYADADNDGYSSGATLAQCLRPMGYKLPAELTATSGDCNDNNAAINPGAAEICDDIDNNCNGQADEPRAIPAPWSSADIGAANGAASLVCSPSNQEEYQITAQGVSSSTSDVMHLTHQLRCGNSSITARVTNVSGGGWAGIVIRESLSPGAKKAVLKTQLSSIIRRELRIAANGATTSLNLNRPQHVWLRLERNGSTITGYTSANGTSWSAAFSATISMGNCVYVGLFSESINVNTTTTATFDNVSVSGSAAPLQAATPAGPAAGQDVFTDNWAVEAFPNPGNGIINLSFSGAPLARVDVRVLNALGETVAHRVAAELENGKLLMDISHKPRGVYYLHISAAGVAPVVKRIIVAGE